MMTSRSLNISVTTYNEYVFVDVYFKIVFYYFFWAIKLWQNFWYWKWSQMVANWVADTRGNFNIYNCEVFNISTPASHTTKKKTTNIYKFHCAELLNLSKYASTSDVCVPQWLVVNNMTCCVFCAEQRMRWQNCIHFSFRTTIVYREY